MKKTNLLTILSLSTCLLFSCCKDDNEVPPVDPPTETGDNKVEMHFDSRYDAGDFEIGKNYLTAGNNQVAFAKVAYFVSNVELITAEGSSFKEPNSYHLILVDDQTEKEKFTITNVPTGNYTKVRFMVGVDSVRNSTIAGATGDLKPDNHMTWMWNTGFIFFSANGKYTHPDSSALQVFTYDIGKNRNLRQVELNLTAPARVGQVNTPKVHIHSDLKVPFGGPNVIDIKTMPAIDGSPADAAASKLVADNYATMFKVHGVQ